MAKDSNDEAVPVRLSYVSDQDPGLRRKASRASFDYLDATGAPVRGEKTIDRIRALAIPPAWTDAWISPKVNGHIQATGRDRRGRKQYRWSESRAGGKRNVNTCVKAVAGLLGNTDAVARSAYIHPAVLDAYAAGTLDLPASDGRAFELAVLRFLEASARTAARPRSVVTQGQSRPMPQPPLEQSAVRLNRRLLKTLA